MALRWIILFIIIAIVELYAFQAVKTFTKVRWVLVAYIIASLSSVVFIVYQFTNFDRTVGQTQMTMFTIGLMLLVLVPKLLMTFIMAKQ